jgi:hypothetical protein
MERSLLRRRPRRVMHIAAVLGIGATTIPIVLGALAEPSAAATISAQQLVADLECDAGWVLWDVGNSLPGVPTPSPTCDPVPSGLAGL